jgi:predicted metal-dependent hydrolase
MKIELGDITIDVIHKDIKNVHLSVNPPNGDVRIAAPMSASPEALRMFALSKLSWIRKEKQKLIEVERESEREYIDRESHYVWGKRYMLMIEEVQDSPSVSLKHSHLVVRVSNKTTKDKIKALVESWYRDQIKALVPELIAKYSSKLNVSVDRLFVQEMKTQWGTCNPIEKSIRLNTDLARRSPEYLEYVVLHEMVHLLESSHSYRFTALMDQMMPNWRYIRDELNRLPLKEIRNRDLSI